MAAPQSLSGGGLEVLIGADMSEFQAAMSSMAAQTQAAAKKVEAAGRTMTMAITGPLAAAGASAVKFAADMENSLAQAQSQAGLTDDTMRQISSSAEDIAVSTGQSFEKVVDAYKFARSAGLDLAESQEIVKTSAKAAAAGFGDQTTLLRGMTTVMASYGKEAGGAREIMNKMVSTAQNMEVRVPALTEVMGQLVQVSKEVGIRFDEMLAAVGSVGEQFGDVKRAGNLMSTSLTQLLDPSEQTRKIMKKIGTSADQLKANIEEVGITQAMVKLRNRTEAAGIEFASLVGSSRSARVMLALTSNEGRRVAEIMKDAKDSTGALNQAFQDSKSFSRLLSRAWQALRVALRPVGDIIINQLSPAIAKMMTKMKGLSTRLQSMDQETRAWWAAVLSLTAAAGPLLFTLGKLTGVLISVGSALAALISPAGAVVAAIAGIGLVVGTIVNRWSNFKAFFGEILSSMKTMFSSAGTFMSTQWDMLIRTMQSALGNLAEKTLGLFADVATFAAKMGVDVAKPWAAAFTSMENKATDWGESSEKKMESLQNKAQNASKKFGEAFKQTFSGILGSQAFFISQAKGSLNDLLNFAQGQFQSLQQLFMGGTGGGGSNKPKKTKGGKGQGQLGLDAVKMAEGIGLLKPALQGLIKKYKQAGDEGASAGSTIASKFRMLTSRMASAVTQANSIGNAFKRMGKTVVSALTGMIAKLGVAAGLAAVLTAVTGGGAAVLGGGFGGILKGLVGLSSGGIIKDGPMPAVLHGNEAVIPLDRMDEMGGGNVSASAEIGIEELRFQVNQNEGLKQR